MADITYSASIRVEKDNLSNTIQVNSVTANMSQVGLLAQTLTLSTSATSISTANLSSVGVAFLRNLSTDTSFTATIGVNASGTFVGFATLRAGEIAVTRLTSGANYQAIGVSGTRLRVDITEG